MTVKLLTEHNLEVLSLKGGCTGTCLSVHMSKMTQNLLIVGGLTAVIYTDTMQAVLMVGGGLTLMGMSKYINQHIAFGAYSHV